ncbi:hypothetical protein [Propionivibrio sp.]|uniref:defense against restriction DarA-related protein n=1 Tax=Propionivibrio sp. TaxID=2212460 RepID=UPI003BF45AA6
MPNSDAFLHIETASHGGAFGHNPIPAPTEAQRLAGNYKMGRVSLYGLSIAIEQPRGTYRTGVDAKTGKRWTNRMAAHYGYFERTKGNDGDGVDCFVGFYPQSESAYVINQNVGGRFDEAKVLIAFPDEDSARRAYIDSYDRGWNGLESIIPVSISQLKWWLKHGNMRRPLRAENLPYEGLEMTKDVQWNSDALPASQTIDQVLYDIRRADGSERLLLDSVSLQDILEDSDGVIAFDALVIPFARLENKMEALNKAMERAGSTVKPAAMQVTEPFNQRGVANVAAIFELSDGQSVSIFFHNPDVTPKKMASTDELISWKWLLNKKDITIVVAPERGEDLNVREVVRRIMKLADKNSAAFIRANGKRAERMAAIGGLKDEITGLEAEFKQVQGELEVAKIEAEGRKAKAASGDPASDYAPPNVAPPPPMPYNFASATPEALALLAVSYAAPAYNKGFKRTEENAYSSAVNIEDKARYFGWTVAWEAIETLPVLDSLFPEIGSAGYLKGTIKKGTKTLMTVSVRVDGGMAFDIDDRDIQYKDASTVDKYGEENESFNQWVYDPSGAIDWAAEMTDSYENEEEAAASKSEEGRKIDAYNQMNETNRQSAIEAANEFGKTKPGYCGAVSSGTESKNALSRKPAGSFTLVVSATGSYSRGGDTDYEKPETFGFVMFSRQKLDKSGRSIVQSGKIGNVQVTNFLATAQLAYEAGTVAIAKAGGVVLESAVAASGAGGNIPPVNPPVATGGDEPPVVATEDPQKVADRALFQSVIDATNPDLFAADLIDKLEAAYNRNAGDSEMDAIFEQAVNKWQEVVMAATANIA